MHAVGVTDIAAAAGTSKVTLYRNFPSKQHLVAAVVSARSDRVHDWLRRETADAAPGPERVLAIFDLLAAWFTEPGFHGCVLVNTATDTRGDTADTAGDSIAAAVPATVRGHLSRYRCLLRERLAELDPPPHDLDALADQLLLLIEGATTIAAVDTDAARSAAAHARAAATILIAAATDAHA